eukprot:1076514-Amphidinium_carterae.1
MACGYEDRTSGIQKLAPPTPSLEDVLRMCGDPSRVRDRLGLLKKQRDRATKLLDGLVNVAFDCCEDLQVHDIYFGGSFG